MHARDPELSAADPEIFALIEQEDARQRDSLRLIASENYASKAVLAATGTSLTNKYAEGYPGKRYYEGMDFIDPIESLAVARARELFGADHANVQPYSGSPANLAALLALCQTGDTIMGLALPAGGHLTHGWKVSATGIYYKAVQYGVRRDDHRIDLDEVRDLALANRPKLIWVGHSAYPRQLDFAGFAAIAREVGAYLAADIAHIAGLVAGGAHPSPVPHADVVTTTTHKTLRGPRGGLILSKAEHAAAIDKAVFPGLQGGPHCHATAAKAVAFREALQPSFRDYAHHIVANARALAEALIARGHTLVSGGTDNHLLLLDLTATGQGGRHVARVLNRCGIELNANAIPFDPRKPFDPSGLRIGLAAITSRGIEAHHMPVVADLIADAITLAVEKADDARCDVHRGRVREFLRAFPAPGL
ncbi:serine hydroxymethyltransferase [Nannocystis bainbridge]|uniref:Serine hydroxymethyltransferase n=1 Tax=Nannocystis bainbridge TaxID=2995303 RepID=A0ABT5EA39_9BACT|nr:serine hydroxymethyltransferase [Nannocystis bainbridge]MDC0722712.1 serine hydroxymethyltransferase [Nannocystis bainbridge]